MARALVIGPDPEIKPELQAGLDELGITGYTTQVQNGVREAVANRRPEIAFLEISGSLLDFEIRDILRKLKSGQDLPVIAILSPDALNQTHADIDVDDFLVEPYEAAELVFRVRRLLRDDSQSDDNNRIILGGLAIDPVSCEVTVHGQLMELTFKEYELLKLLAGSPGRVFNREALLDKIWGYDYFGGDRTVDVHIRRLRSKIEEHGDTFIETVRNIGYRFRTQDTPSTTI